MNPSRFSKRLRRGFWIAAIAIALFTIIGFFVLPPVIKAQLEKRLSAELGRRTTVGKVRVNPYALSVTLEKLDIREPDGSATFLGWNRLYVDFDLIASLGGDWTIATIELDAFQTRVMVNPGGSLNFSDLLAKFTAAPPPPTAAAVAKAPAVAPGKPARPLRIGSLKISGARIDFSDLSRKRPFKSTIGPLSFVLTEFRTAGSRGAPYHFDAVTEAGEKIAWSGTLAADPVHSTGEFTLENILLAKYSPYFEERVQADLTDGALSAHGRYELNLDPKGRVMQMSEGELRLRNLKVLERASRQPVVELPALEVTGIKADGIALKGAVVRVALNGGHIVVQRSKEGALNLLTMLQPVAPPTVPAVPTAAVPPASTPASAIASGPPEVSVGEIALQDFKVDIADSAAPRPVALALSGLNCSLQNFNLADGTAMPLQLSFGWAPQGTVKLDGTLTLKPSLKADLKTEVANLDILPLSPYLEQFLNARLTQGTVATTHRVQIAMTNSGPVVTMEGDVRVEKLGLVDATHNEELAGFGALTLTGLKVTTAPQLAINLAEVRIDAPRARVLMASDKVLNLTTLAKATTAPSPAPAPAPTTSGTPPAAAPKIEVGRVVVADGEFSFTDQSIEPNVRMVVNQFGGTITGLSSETPARADVDLKAAVDGAGPVAIAGKLNPLGAEKFVDLKVSLKGVDLTPLSAYSARFAGYELARGKLMLDVKLLVDGKKIDSNDVVSLDQFTFGAASNSPDATGLPVRLGVALLKDLDGKIVIDLPVQGSLDDPNFRVGKVVLRVVVNLLTKAAVSPFALLGSMFGGGGEELAYQEFAPGASALLPAEGKKLETMTKALTNRPGLSVSLEGGFDAPADRFAIQGQKFADLVRRSVWEKHHATDPNIPPPDQLVITPEENLAMVQKLFDEKFPPGTEFGTPLPKAPPVAPAPAPKPGLLRRVINTLTFQGARDQQSARDREAKVADESKATSGAVTAGRPLAEMVARMTETMSVDENDLRALATARAQAVRNYFTTTAGISGERIFLGKVSDGTANQGKGARVFLELQ